MDYRRAGLAGLAGTAVMTALWLIEPKIGLPRLAVGDMLSSLLAVVTAYTSAGPAVGWVIHFSVGATLALGYAAFFAHRLPGSPVTKGALYGAIIFLLAQLLFMPLVGAGVFSRGDLRLLLGSLIGHLVYGALVGAIYGVPKSQGTFAPT